MKRQIMILILTFLLIGFTGCNKISQAGIANSEIAECYRQIYEQAASEERLGEIDTVKAIVECLGANGYVAVDSNNQVNMTNSEQIIDFDQEMKNKKTSEIAILSVLESGGFIRYDLRAENGAVNVTRSVFAWGEDSFETEYIKEYTAANWSLTENGYLFFGEAHISGEDNPAGRAAFRVFALDEKCRELNQKYVMPIGYGLNNLFISNWSETDYGELNFYDLYEDMYEIKYGYSAFAEAEKEGKTYKIGKSDFEEVFQTFFKVDSQELEKKTTYYADTETYQYRARGIHDRASTPDMPYPEVVSYEENADGTLKLMVNAVWPSKYLDQALSHEVIIRPMEDGTFQYVSNHMISSEKNVEITWYTERLTDEEWTMYYGENEAESVGNMKTSVSLFTEEEKDELQKNALLAAELCGDLYKAVEIVNPESYYSYMTLTDEQMKRVVERLGEQGMVSVSADVNMENHEEVERFYSDYISGKNAEVTIFNVKKSGCITSQTFVHREGELQFYFVGMEWSKDGTFELMGSGVNDLKEILLTEKGYLIYENEMIVEHANLREYFRVKPLSDACRELTRKYIYGLSYVNYNVLVTNWNGDNVEDILMPCMFEDIYRIHTGENLKVENSRIPAEIYEQIMTIYFPVSREQLQSYCGYDADTDSYEYAMIFSKPYPPFGEVVDYTYNDDGTMTLIVDGVWPDYNSDYAFENQIVVQPFEDGTFRYMSNHIAEKELEVPKVGTKKAQDKDAAEVSVEKGYNLPIEESLKEEAESDCLAAMEQIRDIYVAADQGTSMNTSISDETVGKMLSVVQQSGYPATAGELFSDMRNYEQLEDFLENCTEGKAGEIILYEIHSDGGIGRKAFIFDGTEMYELGTKAIWTPQDMPMITYTSYNRIKEWEYTEKGWFHYEYSVPEPPEVSEVINGNVLFRVKPLNEDNIEIAEKYLMPIGYQGNNLFRSNWDSDHMEDIDYNGLFEYLFFIEHGEQFKPEENRVDIPKDEFESLFTKYLPVTAEQLEQYAVYDEENKAYMWERLSCVNYIPTFFCTSSPEVTDIKENDNGTITLTVDGVCEKLGSDQVISHELTVAFSEEGHIRYLSNKILGDGLKRMPEYQYRFGV